MEKISGYARVLARARIDQEVNKPFFGKPFLKYGQCYGLWGYFFQSGGILGAKHAANLDAFGHAFLGLHGPSGAVKTAFTEIATKLVTDSVSDSMKFADYVGADVVKRVGYAGDALTYFTEHGMDKLTPATAENMAWEFSSDGAALGAIHPDMIRRMFDQAHAAIPKEKWERMRSAGLNIPPEQDVMSYEETEQGENEGFMAYCQQCCPDLYSVLRK
ncbi:MAG TPA: hypothetical protein PLE77_03555 [Kiritimatiellia bacterium]|nr:hypothetical protein [Kiritimatiellia bacterium]